MAAVKATVSPTSTWSTGDPSGPASTSSQTASRFATIGTVTSRSTTSEDVTATIADLGSRMATQERSVRRVRQLLGHAQKLGDVVLLESELSRREGDLEAAQARYRALDSEATMAALTLTLTTEDAPAKHAADNSFLAGLGSGWTAVKAATVVLLTVLGALLPFAVVLAVIGVPILLWRRPGGRTTSSTAPRATPDGPDSQPAAS